MDKIGRYAVLGELGRGAMGVVYRAQDPAIGRTVAIKTIRLSDFTDPAERARLKDRLFREAQSAGILSHPGIVTIYDIAEDGHLAYIFMEFVNGPSLDKILSEPAAPAREAVISIWRQTAAALDYAHKKGIVHRDIKPANIMMHDDGTAKVTDFGVAKIVSQNMTQAGTMMGTPSYMSPEQVQGKPVDGRADQFALGVIAYEMLTGEKPFIAEYLPTLLYKLVAEEPAAPQRLNPTLAPEVEGVLRKALAKRPEDRFGTCSEFILSLEEACSTRADWKPMASGQSQNMPTVSATAEPVVAPAETASSLVEAASSPVETAPVSMPAVRSEVEAAPVAMPVEHVAVESPAGSAMPTPRRPRRLEDEDDKGTQPASKAPPVTPAPVFAEATPAPAGGGWRVVMAGVFGLVVVAAALSIAKIYFTDGAQPTFGDPAPGASPGGAQQPAVDPSRPSVDPPAPPPPDPQTSVPAPPAQTDPPIAKPTTTDPPIQRPSPSPSRVDPAVDPVKPTPERPAAPTERIVEVFTKPNGATITFDNIPSLRCTSPCEIPLMPGRHTLLATLAGYRESRRIFELPRDSYISFSLARLSGILSVTSDPADATIFINGQEQQQKTPTSIPLNVGKYRVAVVKEGHPRDESEVEIRDGRTAVLKVEFHRN